MITQNISSPETASTKDKIILILLSCAFVGTAGACLWDLSHQTNTTDSTIPDNNLVIVEPIVEPVTPSENNPESITNTPEINNNNTKKPTEKQSGAKTIDNSIDIEQYQTCLINSDNERSCKDCCDCLTGDANLHKICRDACPTQDFTKNTEIKTFDIESTLGPTGDYSSCTKLGNEQECKQCCENNDNGLSCGDYQYCRTACNQLNK